MNGSQDYQTSPDGDEKHVSDLETYENIPKFLLDTIKNAMLFGADTSLMTSKSSSRSKGFNGMSKLIESHDDVAYEKITKAKHCEQRDDVSKNVGFPLNLIAFTAVLVFKLISIQFSFVMSFFTLPASLSYSLILKLSKMCFRLLISYSTFYPYALLACQKYLVKLGLKVTRALFWLSCASFLFMGLLFSGFLVGGIVMRRIAEEPIHITENLNFDYTKDSPVAFVPANLNNHKVQITVALTLPESEFNQKLGIFQVRVDLLSAKGKVKASSSHPCMLKFKSSQIRFIKTVFKTAPLVLGFDTESQILKIRIHDLAKEYEPSSYLKVALQPRAELKAGAGIPQIYDGSITVESEFSKLKLMIWFWRRTIFVCISLLAFWAEMVTILLFTGCYIVARGNVKAKKGINTNKILTR